MSTSSDNIEKQDNLSQSSNNNQFSDDEMIPTEDLLSELLAGPTVEEYCEAHQLVDLDLAAYLHAMAQAKGRRRIDIIHDAALNETFGYQIFSGDRNPSRDKSLQLAFGLKCTIREAQHLLTHAGANNLYARNRRDAIILFSLSRGSTLQETDGRLYRLGERTIQDES